MAGGHEGVGFAEECLLPNWWSGLGRGLPAREDLFNFKLIVQGYVLSQTP